MRSTHQVLPSFFHPLNFTAYACGLEKPTLRPEWAHLGDQTMAFALKETLASKKQGKDVWYRFWTVIGPCCTDDPNMRALFKSSDEARQSQAFIHHLSFFEPVEVDDIGDWDWNAA